MKKLILSVLALLGMVSGFALTSCGGGGGGGTVVGTKITANGRLGAYVISFIERLGSKESNSYYAVVQDYQGTVSSPILIAMTDIVYEDKQLRSCTGSMSSVSFDPYDSSALYGVVWSINVNTTQVMAFNVEESPRFVLKATSQNSGTISWSGSATYAYRYTGLTGVTEDQEIDLSSRVDDIVTIESM